MNDDVEKSKQGNDEQGPQYEWVDRGKGQKGIRIVSDTRPPDYGPGDSAVTPVSQAPNTSTPNQNEQNK